MIKITPLNKNFGVDISGFDIKNPSPADIKFINDSVHENFVVRIRGQEFSDRDQLEFTKNFGQLSIPTLKQTLGKDQAGTPNFMSTVSNIKINGEQIGQFGNEELDWHSDLNYKERPHAWSLLHALKIPPTGGDTHFVNTRLAYEKLPKKKKAEINNLKARHDIWSLSLQKGSKEHGKLLPGMPKPDNFHEKEWWKTHNGIEHPLVRTHPITNKKALYFGRRLNLYIPGMPHEESEKLLDYLYLHSIKNSEFIWIQKWQLGDLIIWDNRSGMHRRENFNSEHERLMRRTNTQGEKPF
ncbi:MAG: TauD/TfdA dioxygenase family protein [Rhodospirillales bacterium]